MLNIVKSYSSWHRRVFQVALTGALLLVMVSLAAAASFPAIVPVPNGFQPEGIATGRGTDVYVGSLGRPSDDGTSIVGGAIYKADLRSGEGSVLVPSREGRTALGLAVDARTNYVWVAGGPFGTAYVYDGTSGADVAEIDINGLAFPATVVNDVVVTRDAAYLTDSFRPFLYRIALGAGGMLPDPIIVQQMALGGDFVFVPGGFNANGIDATPDGKWLVIVNSATGALYRVDPETAYASEIDLGMSSLPSGDGILLDGKTLYVVQNSLNQIAVVELDPTFSSGEIVGTITSPDFRIPTTVAEFGDALYAVNARFDVAPPPLPGSPPADPNLEYEAVRVLKR
jgi:sugar lactone lactonase YvrE